MSRYEAEEALTVEIILPDKYSDVCEIAAGMKLLALHINRLEYDGDAEQVLISDSIGSLELTAKTEKRQSGKGLSTVKMRSAFRECFQNYLLLGLDIKLLKKGLMWEIS